MSTIQSFNCLVGECESKYTQWTDVSHPEVDCGSEKSVVQAFMLQRDSPSDSPSHSPPKQSRYKLNCCSFTSRICAMEAHTTAPYKLLNGDATYLGRHDLNCHEGLITAFKLQQVGSTVRYNYTCCTMPFAALYNCYSESKKIKDDSAGDTAYYIRHQAICNANHFLSGFRFEWRSDLTELHTAYRCCRV